MLRWYEMPVEDELPAEDYLARAKRFHDVAEELDPAIAERFEAMAIQALEIARQKSLARPF